MQYKKKVLQLAKEHRAAGEIEKVDRYYMPKDDVVSQSLHISQWLLARRLENSILQKYFVLSSINYKLQREIRDKFYGAGLDAKGEPMAPGQ